MTHDNAISTGLTVGNNEPVLCSFEKLGNLLATAKDDWCLIGGAAFLLHGVGTSNLNDIDVLISGRDAARVMRQLNLPVQHKSKSRRFKSKLLLRWDAPEIPIEFMVELIVCSKGVWRQITPKVRQRVSVRDTQLFIPVAIELIEMAHLFGRPKDMERANQLSALH